MCMSEKLFCFVQMNKAKEKSFRSIRRNEWIQCSPHLRHHWSRPIEQHGEISLSHLLRTTVPLILTCFCLHGRQLTPYVDCVSARFSQVTNLGDYWLGALTALPKKREKRPLKRLATGLHVALWDSCWGGAKVSSLLLKYSRVAAPRYRKDRECKFRLIGPCGVQCLCAYCGVFVSLLSCRDYFSA